MMIHLIEGNLQSGESARELEELLGGDSAITVSTTQLAIQICLELLGARTHMIPCILPVNAPPDVLAAVMRAGAQPILMDINGGTLQMDTEKLQIALEELESAAVILTRPGGLPVSEELLELVQDCPTIVDTRLMPKQDLDVEIDLCGTFNVFDLTQACGTGAVIKHKYKKQQKMLRTMRNGVMGHSGSLPVLLARKVLDYLKVVDNLREYYVTGVETLRSELSRYASRGIIPWQASPTGPTPLLVFVPNAKRVVRQLRSHDIEAVQASFPLHLLDEVRQRFQNTPEYPVAEAVVQQVIAIPVVPTLRTASNIARIIGEVDSD